jgi:hypothetical protein
MGYDAKNLIGGFKGSSKTKPGWEKSGYQVEK